VAKQWQKSMATAKVTHLAAEFGLRQVILRKLEYPLVATTFNRQQCANIMKPILSTGLPSAGIIRSFPRALVHGPWRWGGLNVPNLHTEQLVTHIHTILKFGGNLQDMTGNLLQASYEVLRLESGLSGNVFDLPECAYTYITKTWLLHTCEICKEFQIRIEGMDEDFLPPRVNDVEIMRVFIRAGYRSKELEALNRCRMYTKDIFLSDICNATGTQLEQHRWTHAIPGESTYTWPYYPKPTPTEWRGWQLALQRSLSLGRNLQLPIPLGKWILHKHHKHIWYYHAGEDALFHTTPDGTNRHGILPRRSRTKTFHAIGELTAELPPSAELQIASTVLQGESC